MGAVLDSKQRMARPGRIRIRLWDDAAGGTPLEIPARRMWPMGLIFAAMFVIFAGVAWTMVVKISGESVRDVFDLMFVLFEGFWLLGWSVGVLILGALAVLFFFYTESVRLHDGRLVHAPKLGPLKIIIEYDLARVRKVRLENTENDKVRIRFDYDGGSSGLGDAMPRADGELLVNTIRSAAVGAGSVADTPTAAPAQETPRPERPAAANVPPPSLTSSSALALIAANLVPLAGVLFFGWDLASVIVLFWAESAVIGFYTVLKMTIVGKLAAIFAAPFFVGHFGGFMAGHFLLIYSLFVRGANAAGPEPGVRQALLGVFNPLWLPLAVLFISHGVSFSYNFVGRREYEAATMKGLMIAPYNRIVVMQLALIFGGWIILLLRSPAPALAVLILLKTALDFTAHRKEHGES